MLYNQYSWLTVWYVKDTSGYGNPTSAFQCNVLCYVIPLFEDLKIHNTSRYLGIKKCRNCTVIIKALALRFSSVSSGAG